ncbi:hypothetical protein A2U01_0045435, partial [Trifolium medium]|nr:hypothetical protein [Trifolium medium]
VDMEFDTGSTLVRSEVSFKMQMDGEGKTKKAAYMVKELDKVNLIPNSNVAIGFP